MDFRGRVSQLSNKPAGGPAPHAPGQADGFGGNPPVSKFTNNPGKAWRIGGLLLLFSLTILIIALTLFFVFTGHKQQRAVAEDQYQAVFLNNGQVYFGKIASVGGKTLDLRNIYYLQTSGTGTTQTTSSDSSSVSLVKLGCELHAPNDRMLINADQIIFWENIQDSSQVVKAIDAYNKQNNGKINCSEASQNSTQQAPSSSSTGTGTSTGTTATTPATGAPTTTKKP